MFLLVEFIVAVLIADLITGVVHWWEDTYGNPNWPLAGKYIVEPNLLHHQNPRELAMKRYFALCDSSLYFAVILIGVPWLLFDWHPFLYVATIGISSQANQVHSWAHRTEQENGKVIRILQRIGIIQSRRHHGLHHKSPYMERYCILTNALNPVLDRLGVWRKTERVLEHLFGIRVLRGSAIRNGL